MSSEAWRLPARDFADVAARYCELIDRRSDMSAVEFIRSIHGVIPELLFRGSAIPEGLVPKLRLPDRSPSEYSQQFFALLDPLVAFLGDIKLTWVPEAESPLDTPYTAGSLADDLADVYLDPMPGLKAPREPSGDVQLAAASHWRHRYESHWGRHALIAYQAVHLLLFSYVLPEEP